MPRNKLRIEGLTFNFRIQSIMVEKSCGRSLRQLAALTSVRSREVNMVFISVYSRALALHSAAAGIQGRASFFSKPLSRVQRLVY